MLIITVVIVNYVKRKVGYKIIREQENVRRVIKEIVKRPRRPFARAIYSIKMNRGQAEFLARLVVIT